MTLWHIDESSTAGSWNDADPSQARAFVCNGDPNSNTGSAADPARLGTGLPGDAEISLEDAVRAGAACKRLFGREAAKSVLSNEPRRVSGQLSALSSFLSNSLAWARCSRARPFAS